jgi:hypothetical protein
MIPLRIVESDREGFDQPVVELWRDDEFVGMVFWDEDVAVVQVYSDDDGDVFDLGVGELVTALELAERIVTPEEFRTDVEAAGTGSDDWSEEDPATLELVGEFDPQAAHRTEDGEGFFPRPVAVEFIRRCDELGLAVVEMEGFDLEGNVLKPRPNLTLTVRIPDVADWASFTAAANATALDTLQDWPSRSSLVVAFVVQQPDGEAFVA